MASVLGSQLPDFLLCLHMVFSLLHALLVCLPLGRAPNLIGLRPHSYSLVVVVRLLSRVWLFVTPWTAAHQASLAFTISRSLLRFVFIELVMPSNHLLLCQSSPTSGSFPMSWFFTSGGQSIGESLGKCKTTVRDHLTPVRMTNIKKTREKSLRKITCTLLVEK